jgi:hypothetical protein
MTFINLLKLFNIMYAYSSITRKESKIPPHTILTDYEALKRTIIIEHSRLREDPMSYIPILEQQKSFFKGNILQRPKQTPIITKEGIRGLDLAIEFLKTQKPVPALTHDSRLSQAANDHVADHGPNGTVSHESTNGKVISERLERYCEWDNCCGENIDVGSLLAEEVIVSLLVDDGIRTRNHRNNLFNTSFRSFGIACGPHKTFGIMSVIVYNGRVRQLNSSYFDYSNFKYEYPAHVTHAYKHGDKKEPQKAKNIYQKTDPDAPDNTISVKIEERFRIIKDPVSNDAKKISVIKKQYALDDGTYHVIEVEEY